MNQIEQMEYISKGFKSFNKIVNKQITFVYCSNDKYKELVFKANKADFMHLCGMKYKDPKTKKYVSAGHFYNLVEKDRIVTKFLETKKDGSTDLKLKVIERLDSLLNGTVRIIDQSIFFPQSSFTGAIRSERMIFALGLCTKDLGYGPKSLFNLKTGKNDNFKNSYKVEQIYITTRNTEKEIVFESEEFKTIK